MRKLLDAAMVVFARRGYHAARVDDIVKVARTSHGTFYLYFSNKEDLLRALVDEAGEVVAALDAALGPGRARAPTGWQELRAWMEQFSEAWQRYAPVLRAWTDLVMSDTVLGRAGPGGGGRCGRAPWPAASTRPGPHAGHRPQRRGRGGHRHGRPLPLPARSSPASRSTPSAIDTLTTMVHRALFGGGPPPAHVLAPHRPADAA